jgi:hypothetical protein
MSVYRCDRCENYYDADYEGCFEHPTDPTACLCESCSNDLLDEVDLMQEIEQIENCPA